MINEHEDTLVNRDEFCMKCRYNLRTLSVAGVCPECATPVAKSLALSQNAAVVDMRRLTLATKMLLLTGGLLGLAYLDRLASRFSFHKFFHSPLLDLLDDLRTFLQRALHIALGVLVFAATLKLVQVFRTRHLASTLAATACLVTAGFHLVFYVAVDANEWVWLHLPRHFMKQDDFDYFWNNWCYAGISCCELVLTLGAVVALRKYARIWKNRALLVTTALYLLLVAPIFLAWSVTGPLSGRTVSWLRTRHPVTWYFHITDDAAPLYAQWEWALAAAMILYWMQVNRTLKNHGLLRTLKENRA